MDTDTATRTRRHFHRCHDCLDVLVVGEIIEKAACGVCGGTLTWIGEVKNVVVYRPQDFCPCDGRCTGAMGPSCDCQCGGANHGTGRVVTILRPTGDVVTVTGQRNPAKLLAVAVEFRAAVESTRAAISAGGRGDAVEAKRASGYISGRPFQLFREYGEMVAALNVARWKTSHAGRMKALREIQAWAAPAPVAVAS